MDLPRKVKYKPRKVSAKVLIANPNYRMKYTYNDLKQYMQDYPDIPVIEMDTIEGSKRGKFLLTLFFRNYNLMLSILLKNRTQ